MAKAKVFPKAPVNEHQDPHVKFSELAARIIKVPKTAIAERDEHWRKSADRSRSNRE
jgi:hypothetical protein